MSAYNASVEVFDQGQYISVFVAEVDAEDRILRSNAVWSHLNGRPEYDPMVRRLHPDCEYRIHRDGCQRYRQALDRLMLPPAYRA